LIFFEFDHEIEYGIGNKLYILVRGVMGKVYLQIFSESRHVDPRVDFIDFSSGVGKLFKMINYGY